MGVVNLMAEKTTAITKNHPIKKEKIHEENEEKTKRQRMSKTKTLYTKAGGSFARGGEGNGGGHTWIALQAACVTLVLRFADVPPSAR